MAWLIFFASLIITLFIWTQVRNNIIENAETSFNTNVDEVKFAIERRMSSYEQILMGGVALFKVKENLSRKDFHVYVMNLQIEKNFPGIQGMGFSKVIRPYELQEHIRNIKKEGFPDYKVWPEGKRDIYTSIVYLEPFSDRNLRAFGYDMFSEPIRKQAMSKAIDIGIPFASGKVTLVQETETDIQNGVLVYLPVYHNEMKTSTVEERRRAIFGFVYSPFRMNDLMKGILGNKNLDIIIDIFDGNSTDNANLLYSSRSTEAGKRLFSAIHSFVSDNRTWTILFRSTYSFENDVDVQKSWIVLISGSLISILLFISAFSFKKTEEVYKNLEQILEAAGEGIYGLDAEGKCIFINDAALAMIGYSKEECIGKRMHDLIHYNLEDGSPCPFETCSVISSITQSKKISSDNEVYWRKDGSMFHVEFFANPIIEKGSLVKGTVVAFSDVTERKKNEEQINTSLKEKEVLLKEIHHRVKNNMQVVSSLLNLQYQYLQNADEQTIKAFQDSQNRIRSMALIHEKLYQTKDLANINFGEYIRDLVTRLYNSYKYETGGVKIDIDTQSIDLNMDISISLGLVINELVSNAFKHAFNGRENNHLVVSMLKRDEVYELIIADNGKGFSSDIDFKNTDTLGLQLVNTLTSQIDGSINLENKMGSKFIIKFPV